MKPSSIDIQASSQNAGERQIVAMSVGGEVYGVSIDLVHTVILPQPITSVPRTPSHVKGVINLRGRVVPIVDLRTRFGLPAQSAEDRQNERIVMLDIDGQQTGMIVDGVSEVLRLSESCIEPPSEYLSPETAFVTAIARAPIAREATSQRGTGDSEERDRLILMLDVYKALQGCNEGIDSQVNLEALPQAA